MRRKSTVFAPITIDCCWMTVLIHTASHFAQVGQSKKMSSTIARLTVQTKAENDASAGRSACWGSMLIGPAYSFENSSLTRKHVREAEQVPLMKPRHVFPFAIERSTVLDEDSKSTYTGSNGTSMAMPPGAGCCAVLQSCLRDKFKNHSRFIGDEKGFRRCSSHQCIVD